MAARRAAWDALVESILRTEMQRVTAVPSLPPLLHRAEPDLMLLEIRGMAARRGSAPPPGWQSTTTNQMDMVKQEVGQGERCGARRRVKCEMFASSRACAPCPGAPGSTRCAGCFCCCTRPCNTGDVQGVVTQRGGHASMCQACARGIPSRFALLVVWAH